MSYHKLVLHPLNPWAILHDPALVLDALRTRGLIGDSFGWDGELHYAPGPSYGELVLFRRAAQPEPGSLHVSLTETADEPTFLGTTNAQSPRCPTCQGVLSDWRTQLLAWQREKHQGLWACARCGTRVEIQRLDWVHTGGIARYSLDLWGVREGAAIPSAELLGLLERLTFERWNYFYYRLEAGPARRGHSAVQPR